VRLGLFRSVLSRLYACYRGQLPRRMPGPSGPKYSRYVPYDTQWHFGKQEQKRSLFPLPLDPRLRQLKAPLPYALASSNRSALPSVNWALPRLVGVPLLVSVYFLTHLHGEVLDEF
jgi:hypothetical protein